MRKREVTKTFVKRSHKKSEFSRAFTISELIETLSNIKENHGDIDYVFVEAVSIRSTSCSATSTLSG